MRNLRLLSTTAAVLLLGVGAVSAQTTKGDEAPAGAPAAQQNAPAEKVAPAKKVAPSLKSSQRKAPETTGQAAPTAPESDNQKQLKSQTMDKDAPADAATKSSSEERSRSTTGQGAAAGSAKLSAEQSTKISAIIRQHKVAPVRLNVSVRVGTRFRATSTSTRCRSKYTGSILNGVAITTSWSAMRSSSSTHARTRLLRSSKRNGQCASPFE